MALDISNAVSSSSAQDRILFFSKRLFATHGYERTTTSAIARAAQTSESQIIRHFGGKQGLLEAIFDSYWAQLVAEMRVRFRNIECPIEKLRIVFSTTVALIESDPDFKRLLLLEGRRPRSDTVSSLLSAGFLGFVALLDEVMLELQERRLLWRGVPAHALRSALMGAVEGLLRDRHLADCGLYKAEYHLEDASRVFELLLTTFLVCEPKGCKGPLEPC